MNPSRSRQTRSMSGYGSEIYAIDVAKASGVACTRVPDEDRPGRRKTHVWTVTATVPAITELADHLRCHQIQVVTLESTDVIWDFQDQQ